MKRGVCAALLLVVLATGSVSSAANAGWDAAKKVEARGLIDRFLRPFGTRPQAVPALSIALSIDGDLVWADGLGETSPGRSASADTVYRIGSLTKQFTAAGLLSLIERGAASVHSAKSLRLDAPASDYMDGLERWEVEGQSAITVRSLLNMTSNLPNYTRRPPPGLDPWGTISSQELLSALKTYRPSGWPGSFEYSNTSYFVLSEIASSVRIPGRTGVADFQDYVREFVLTPAGLHSTGFAGDRALEERLPPARYKRKPVFANPEWLRGSADMMSTVKDLYQWNKALMSGEILSEASREDMFREAGRVTPTNFYGMGWFILPRADWTHYSHTGSVAGYTSCNVIARTNDRTRWISITLLSNAEGVDGLEQLADDVLELIERGP